MSQGNIFHEEAGGLLCATDVHPIHPHCVPVLGIILDQQRRRTGQDHAGRHHSAHHDNTAQFITVSHVIRNIFQSTW